jgi:hypothetical protein
LLGIAAAPFEFSFAMRTRCSDWIEKGKTLTAHAGNNSGSLAMLAAMRGAS